MKQLSLIPAQKPIHGGDLRHGKRKILRPLAKNRPIHLILKSKLVFKESNGVLVLTEARRFAEKFGIKIVDHAFGLGDDHLHLVITIPGRREYNSFIRSLSGLLARRFGAGVWSASPFTRVGFWGQDFRGMLKYLELNRLEAAGEMPYSQRNWKPEWVDEIELASRIRAFHSA